MLHLHWKRQGASRSVEATAVLRERRPFRKPFFKAGEGTPDGYQSHLDVALLS
jgi:hypothetical protein